MRERYYAGVGSRETPEDVLALMRRLGEHLCNLGWGLSSGDAEGADRAFYEGAYVSPNFYKVPSRIYLAWNGVWGRYHDPSEYFFDATRYTDTYETAKQMALEARGSFEGLKRGGIGMHTRNVFQIHGHTLQDPVGSILYWGQPVGKTEKVKGGTNTALQLAVRANVPIRLNLYKEEDRLRAEKFLTNLTA